jgi:hypothetical protein
MGTTGEWRSSTKFKQDSTATGWTGLDRPDVQPDDALVICLGWDLASLPNEELSSRSAATLRTGWCEHPRAESREMARMRTDPYVGPSANPCSDPCAA